MTCNKCKQNVFFRNFYRKGWWGSQTAARSCLQSGKPCLIASPLSGDRAFWTTFSRHLDAKISVFLWVPERGNMANELGDLL